METRDGDVRWRQAGGMGRRAALATRIIVSVGQTAGQRVGGRPS